MSDPTHHEGTQGVGGAVDWQAVKRVYEAGTVPIGAICAAHGLRRSQLRRARCAGGWQKRPQVAQPGPNQGSRPSLLLGSAKRLRGLIAAQIRRVETRMGAAWQDGAAEAAATGAATCPAAAADPAEAAALLADLQVLAELTRALEGVMRAIGMKTPAAGRGAAGRSSATGAAVGGGRSQLDEDPAHVEWMRAELKRRISILRRNAGLDREDGAGGAGGA